MSNKEFLTLEALLAHMRMDPEDTLVFPWLPGVTLDPDKLHAKDWVVEVNKDGVKIRSPWYNVEQGGRFKAAMIHGIHFDFGDESCSGVIRFGNKNGLFTIADRKSLTAESVFPEGHCMLKVIVAQPDRAFEYVAVLYSDTDQEHIRSLDAEDWLALFDDARDALELLAVRELRRAFTKSADEDEAQT